MHCGTNSFVISFLVTAHLYYRYLTQIPIFFNILTDTEEGLKTFIRGRVSEPHGAGAVTLARLHLKYLLNNSRKLYGT